MAPVELVRLARGKAHRHERLGRNPCPFVPPGLHEPVHAIVRTVIAAPAQLLEQPLRRAAFPPRQLRFLLQDLGQNLDPLAQLRRGLHTTLVLELGRLAADHLAHRRARHRQRPHDLLDRPMLIEIGPPYLPDNVHANHPPNTLPSRHRHKGRDADTQR